MRIDEIHKLAATIEAMRKLPQTAARELDIAEIELRIRVAEAKREVIVSQRAELLFDAFKRVGRMRVMHRDGTISEYDGHPHNVSGVQRVFNAKHRAADMASWSEP